MTSRSIGSTASIPPNSIKTQIQPNDEVDIGAWLYMDSGVLINGSTNDPRYYVSQKEGEDILNGDLSIIKNALLEGFKKQEPQSTIEITWLQISWDTADFTHIGMQTGYWFTNFRIQCAIKNVQAGLAPLIIAAIIIAIPIIIAVLTLCLTIAWVAYKIVTAAENAFGDGGVVVVGLIVLVGLGALLFFVMGGSFKGTKKGIELQGRRG